jgi:hypothetical protein
MGDDFEKDDAESVVEIPLGSHARVGVRAADGKVTQVVEVDTRKVGPAELVFVRDPDPAKAASRAALLGKAGALRFVLAPKETIYVEQIKADEERAKTYLEGLADMVLADDVACARVIRKLDAAGRLAAVTAAALSEAP